MKKKHPEYKDHASDHVAMVLDFLKGRKNIASNISSEKLEEYKAYVREHPRFITIKAHRPPGRRAFSYDKAPTVQEWMVGAFFV